MIQERKNGKYEFDDDGFVEAFNQWQQTSTFDHNTPSSNIAYRSEKESSEQAFEAVYEQRKELVSELME